MSIQIIKCYLIVFSAENVIINPKTQLRCKNIINNETRMIIENRTRYISI